MSDGQLFRATLFDVSASPFGTSGALRVEEDGALLVREGRIAARGPFATLQRTYPDVAVTDWRGGIVLPGCVDAHVHFPQLRIIGSLGRSLLDWLEHVALPEEARMADVRYAVDTARRFVATLASHGTTTAMVFGAHFAAATAALFDEAASRGLRLIAGMVVSDRELRPELHQDIQAAYEDSSALIRRFHGQRRALYAVTPRFAVSTSEAMLEMCGSLVREHDGIRVQSHINENPDEIASVKRLFPWAADYFAVYEQYGLTGSRTVLAHNVHPATDELRRMAAARTSVAHCAASNAALGSGMFPFRRHLDAGVRVALGTDVGAGTGPGILKESLTAYLLQRVAPQPMSLDPAQLLYLSTLAGAEALGVQHETGNLDEGKSADFVHVRPAPDTVLQLAMERADTPVQMLSAVLTLAGAESIREVRVAGDVVHSA